MMHILSGCFSNQDSLIYHSDQKRLYILADGNRSGKRGLLAQTAVLEAFKQLGDLPENMLEEEFKIAVSTALYLSKQLIERNVRNYIRSGAVKGLVKTMLEQIEQGETFSAHEHKRNEALAIDALTHEILHGNKQKDTLQVGSSALVALIRGEKLFIAHIGDSRLEVVKKKEDNRVVLKAITIDQTYFWLRMKGKLPPGAMESKEAFALQKKMDEILTEDHLHDEAVLKEAWKMKALIGQQVSVKEEAVPDFYAVELNSILSIEMYTHGVIEHCTRSSRVTEIVDAEKIGIPPSKIAQITTQLAEKGNDSSLGMIHIRVRPS